MQEFDDIVRLPEINARLGSCPECGKPIWENDLVIDPKYDDNYTRYCCMECGSIIVRKEIIPF